MNGNGFLAPGSELAPGYRVLALVNRGGELDVYHVHSEERACHCVAKVPRGDIEPRPASLKRLRLEGRLLTRLTHPHLVRGYEVIQRDGHPILIAEALDGATLSYLVREERVRLTVSDLANLGLQLSSALHYLHGLGWLHLDVKPSNVVEDRGFAKILDLNFARRAGRVPAGYGTAQYLSPEQARGGRVGPPADVFGLGGTLWAAATGLRPFGVSGREQLERRAEPLGRARRLPRALTGIVDACLDPDPNDRPSLAEVRIALMPLSS